jgi:hypothetical protein
LQRKEEEILSIKVKQVIGEFAVLEGGIRIELNKRDSIQAGDSVTVKMTRGGLNQQWQATLFNSNKVI